MHPVGTNKAASFPKISAARRSSRLTVGSSPYTSSPTTASAIARRISAVGRVTVSLRKSTIFSSGVRLSGSLRIPLLAIVLLTMSLPSSLRPLRSLRPQCKNPTSDSSEVHPRRPSPHQLHKHLVRNTQSRRRKSHYIASSFHQPRRLQSLKPLTQ